MDREAITVEQFRAALQAIVDRHDTIAAAARALRVPYSTLRGWMGIGNADVKTCRMLAHARMVNRVLTMADHRA